MDPGSFIAGRVPREYVKSILAASGSCDRTVRLWTLTFSGGRPASASTAFALLSWVSSTFLASGHHNSNEDDDDDDDGDAA